jgi:hypothetical protein
MINDWMCQNTQVRHFNVTQNEENMRVELPVILGLK